MEQLKETKNYYYFIDRIWILILYDSSKESSFMLNYFYFFLPVSVWNL